MSLQGYRGLRQADGCWVWRVVDHVHYPLNQRLDLWSHSPTGFEWGYGGSGPAQLALAILADFLAGDDDQAVDLHQAFKWEVVAKLPREEWRLSRDQVAEWIFQHDQARADLNRSAADDGPVDLSWEPDKEERHSLDDARQ